MATARSQETLKVAVQSMYRIRVTESPPDEHGQRTIWHRGAKGAELVSWVDASGRMVKQDFYLFEDVFRWQRGQGLSTGSARQADRSADKQSAQDVAMDGDVATRRDRLERAEASIGDYTGEDKYLLHLRALLLSEAGAYGAWDDAPVTRSNDKLTREEFEQIRREAAAGLAPKPTGLSPKVKVGLVAGGTVLLAALATALLAR